ncbi:MAG: hypothetical protein COW65_07425 [Cytophagales bacterium CG18_big_fil_WC_8_21_14_2_50_42_9]|nr:MAG: hypothetical protein COW65_07425 [Cytophagales bacterium CG18_big_fil_WC_8_21_14_2_50_42_9]
MKFIFSLLICLLLFSGFSSAQTLNEDIKQGILGTVVVREGNLMPAPSRNGKPQSAHRGKPQNRELLIYELTNLAQVKANGTFYSEVQTKPVAKVTAGADGIFQVFLKPGRYTVFSQEPQGLFANQFDGNGNIFPVEVVADRLTLVEFVIDYNASY